MSKLTTIILTGLLLISITAITTSGPNN